MQRDVGLMTYLLDTNAAIALLKENPQLLHHVRRVGRTALTEAWCIYYGCTFTADRGDFYANRPYFYQWK